MIESCPERKESQSSADIWIAQIRAPRVQESTEFSLNLTKKALIFVKCCLGFHRVLATAVHNWTGAVRNPQSLAQHYSR